ncbi:MAG TPA: transporter [Candidatus Omnitrophota bacterium]|nr:transporter [Candidatus Omnitrophota bacterium]HSA30192.1 transporter [Candidatus Omnitrophota bacterium]
MKKILYATGWAFFIFFTSNTWAARPLATNDAGVVAVGALETEYGYEYVHASDRENNHGVVLTTGLLKNLDFGVEIPYQFIELEDGGDPDGFSDLIFTTKWSVSREHDTLPDFSLSFSYKTESGNDEKSLGTGRPEYTLTSIFSKTFERFTYHVNMGCSAKHELEDTLNYGFAMEYAVNERLNVLGEIAGDTILSGKFDNSTSSGLIGFNYAINGSLTYDAGLKIGISESAPDFTILTGLTFAFGS